MARLTKSQKKKTHLTVKTILRNHNLYRNYNQCTCPMKLNDPNTKIIVRKVFKKSENQFPTIHEHIEMASDKKMHP